MEIKVVLVSTHQINSSTAPTDEPRAATLIKAFGKVTDKKLIKANKKLLFFTYNNTYVKKIVLFFIYVFRHVKVFYISWTLLRQSINFSFI